jgi:rod shape-determining protein MreD
MRGLGYEDRRSRHSAAVTTLKIALVLLVALVLQVCLVARFSLDGARGDLLLLLALAAAVAGGPEKGAIVGFAAGLTLDLVLDTPLGLSALVYCIVGYAVGSFQGSVLRVAWWMPVASIVIGSAAGVVIYAIAGVVLGQATLSGPSLTTIVVVVAAFNGLLALPATRLMRWALADSSHRRFTSL